MPFGIWAQLPGADHASGHLYGVIEDGAACQHAAVATLLPVGIVARIPRVFRYGACEVLTCLRPHLSGSACTRSDHLLRSKTVAKAREIYVPDLDIYTLKLKARNFR